ncbi:uncharacterized protein F4812DRAFT_412560 [Daldinia caldariorum]|uniref:uncharacterized protein n=1 Tax=Daldinia caldariorum TaxID=326644 RepID=UPI002007F788|nr:uncharacterized protein F4812DRAFT_412560 [Daldinia caldariorum]KAI1471042.1 hypothetical protein F4812DRAFT_412560 [Daldinia caldariorum]
MGIIQLTQSRAILSLVIFTILILSFQSAGNLNNSDPVVAKMADANNVISKLKVSVRQVSSSTSSSSSSSPPKLAIAVTNTYSSPVTILSWNSPLDPLALQLGLVSFSAAAQAGSDDDDYTPIQIPTIQIRRKMPPETDALVTIGAGQTKEQVLELRDPIVPLDKLRGRVRVACAGEWMSVWLLEVDAVPKASLEKAGASDDAYRGPFQSEAVDMEL